MSKYDIETVTVKATPQEILEAYETVLKQDDWLGEHVSCIAYLPYEFAKPYLKDGATADEWPSLSDAELRAEFEHYATWWRQKIENERGISCWRGRNQFAIRMMLAGCPEWREVYEAEGYYSRSAYATAAKLFGLPAAERSREEEAE